MSYFVTGATGFIGRHLMELLVKRGAMCYVLVREASEKRLLDMAAQWGAEEGQIRPVIGDLSQPKLGIADKVIDEMRGNVDHVVHSAAIYDMETDDESTYQANVDGTREAIAVARDIGTKVCFHHVSSIAVAGRFRGNFLEAMYEEGQDLGHPYFRTKYESEGLVRELTDMAWRVYRPGVVIGHSRTGVMDKIDGPYYFFKMLKRSRELLPPWLPMIGIEGKALPMVPVDYVASSMDYLMHKDGLDGQAFHIVDPNALSVGDAMNVFARAGHTPEFAMRLDLAHFGRMIPGPVKSMVGGVPAIRKLWYGILEDLGIPPSIMSYATMPTTFDTRDIDEALAGSGLSCPKLEDYAWRIWDYWERNLDPDATRKRNVRAAVEGKIVVITGASSGIGREVAMRVASLGGLPLLLARRAEQLEEVAAEIRAAGGDCQTYPSDIADLEEVDRVVKRILDDHGRIDVLINNAGRSIRRSVELSYDRFHDFERTMQLNYFGALRLILGFLPVMTKRRSGHIINISSVGVQAGAARFSAYIASKSALDSFTRAMGAEVRHKNIHVTTIYMPLVRTPMIAPTRLYDHMPAMETPEAAEMVVKTILTRPKQVSTRLGTFGAVIYALTPRLSDRIQNLVFTIVPESARAKGDTSDKPQEVTMEAIVLSNLLRGMYL